MTSRARILARFGLSRQRLSYAATIAGLALFLWTGHRTHWHFATAHWAFTAEPHRFARRTSLSEAQSLSNLANKAFDQDFLDISDAARAKAGVQLGRVERKRMTTELTTSQVPVVTDLSCVLFGISHADRRRRPAETKWRVSFWACRRF